MKRPGLRRVRPRSEPVVKSLGKSDSVNGVSCDWKEVTRDDVVELRVCVSDWSDIEGGEELRAIGLEMKDFASSLVDAMGSAGFAGSVAESPMAAMEMAGGFPLISENFNQGQLSRRSRFQSVEDVAIPDGEFAPPGDYKKKDIGKMSR